MFISHKYSDFNKKSYLTSLNLNSKNIIIKIFYSILLLCRTGLTGRPPSLTGPDLKGHVAQRAWARPRHGRMWPSGRLDPLAFMLSRAGAGPILWWLGPAHLAWGWRHGVQLINRSQSRHINKKTHHKQPSTENNPWDDVTDDTGWT
jgi:hypothetical protein